MRWLVSILAVLFLFNTLNAGFAFLASIALLVYGFATDFFAKPKPVTHIPQAYRELTRLALLRRELYELHRTGTLDTLRYEQLCADIDHCQRTICNTWLLSHQQRRKELAQAWDLLGNRTAHPVGAPPWQPPAPPRAKPAPVAKPAESVAKPKAATPVVTIKPPPAPVHKTAEKPLVNPVTTASPPLAKGGQGGFSKAPGHLSENPPQPPFFKGGRLPTASEPPAKPQPAPAPKKPEPPPRPSWAQRAHQYTVQILMPFVKENLGWVVGSFLGVFMTVAGTIFLVAVSESTFTQTLIVFITLSIYTAGALWGGYALRKWRPGLQASSSVLLILGALLVPLDFAAAVRLLLNAGDHFGLQLLTAGLGLSAVAVFAVAMRLASGLMDRALMREQPTLFILLAVLQGGVPLLHLLPHWGLLVGLHLVLLALLSYSVGRFARHWLHAIFVERNQLTYYAAGTLIYAAVVSFVHLTWAAPFTMPAGYAGPFVMALCGLLFYVDTHFKNWTKQQTWLGHFTFVVYALSVVAVVLSWQGTVGFSLLLSLGLATVLYGAMMWRYLSLPPLYLFLAGGGGLYALLVLRPFAESWHFLLSLPAFLGLLGLQKLAHQRDSAPLALVVYRVSLMALTGLTAWSLFHGQPSVPAMLTPLAATLLLLHLIGLTPAQVLHAEEAPARCYLVSLLAALSLAYAPLWLGFNWFTQLSIALVGLSAVLIGWGLSGHKTLCRADALFDSALLSLGLALGLTFYGAPQVFWPWVLLAAGGVLVWISLALNTRPLFYLGLLALGGTSVLFKLLYFPHPSSGFPEMLAVLALWAAWWWLEKQAADYKQVRATLAAPPAPRLRYRLFGLGELPVADSGAAMMYPPLAQAVYLVWLWGLIRIGSGLLAGEPAFVAFAALAGAVATGLLAGQSRFLILLPLAFLLLLSGLAGVPPWLFSWQAANVWPLQPFFLASYGLLLWPALSWWLQPPLRWTQVLGWRGDFAAHGGRQAAADWLHACLVVLFSTAALMILYFGQHLADLDTLFPLGAALMFFSISGYRRQWRLYSYVSLALAVLLAMNVLAWFTATPLLRLYTLAWLPLLTAMTALVLGSLAWWLRRLSKPRDEAPRVAILYAAPLYHAALLAWGWALLSSVSRFAAFWPGPFTLWLPLAFGVSIAVSLLLTLSWRSAGELRGLLLPVLLSLAAAASVPHLALNPHILMLWGFVLWGIGHYVLPPINDTWRQWAIEPTFCRVAGLLSYAWAVLLACVLLYTEWNQEILAVAGAFVLLALAQLPLLSGWSWAAAVRGLGIPLLLSLGFAALSQYLYLSGVLILPWQILWVTGWSLVLWSLGKHLLPWLNQAKQNWEVDAWFSRALGVLVYAGAVLGAWVLLLSQWQTLPLEMAGIFLLLALVPLPLLSGWPQAAVVRGFGVPVLLTIAFGALLSRFIPVTLPITLSLPLWLTAWSLLLWALGHHLLPSFNRAKPAWGVDPWFSRVLAVLIYVGAILGAGELWLGQGHVLSVEIAAIFLLLALVPLPLLSGWSWASEIRGFGVPVLLTIAFVALLRGLEFPSLSSPGFFLLIVWSMGLWTVARRMLPAFNRWRPAWAIAPAWWPLWGLVLALAGMGLDAYGSGALRWPVGLAFSGYLLLMLYSHRWWWLAWAAVVTVLSSGIALLLAVFMPVSGGDVRFMVGAALWVNLLLIVEALWQRYATLAEMRRALAAPLYWLPVAGLYLALTVLGLYTGIWLISYIDTGVAYELKLNDISMLSGTLAMLLALSFSHVLARRPHVLHAHALLITLFVLFAQAVVLMKLAPEWLLVGWSVVLVVGIGIVQRWGSNGGLRRAATGVGDTDASGARLTHPTVVTVLWQAAWHWLPVVFALALLFTVLSGEPVLGGLAVLAAVAVAAGLLVAGENYAALWLAGSGLLGLALMHLVWLYFLPAATPLMLLPWYALQAALLANLNLYGPKAAWLPRRLQQQKRSSGPLLLGLVALPEWLIHVGMVIMAGGAISSVFGVWDYLATSLAGALLVSGLWPWLRRENLEVYGTALLLAMLGVYLRLLWLGPVPLTVWDTTLLLGAAYALMAAQHLKPDPALYRLTLLLPALAVLTVPLQAASAHASLTLLAIAALYLFMRRDAEQSLPVYLALLALNVAIYLWVPAVATDLGLLQLYTVPAAITVLLMLQLHLLELKPSVAHAVRLTALATLYASATLDVFLRPELDIFLIALTLSLAGVVLGIGLRIRAFLYTGLVFLILNVVGQLIRFSPEELTGQGIVLIVLGGLILAVMVGYNILRDKIHARLRLIRADLEEWA